jgi:FK506-binding protein 1
MTMSVGERCKLTLSPDYGYGARGVPGMFVWIDRIMCSIPPNSTLIFDVELLKIN